MYGFINIAFEKFIVSLYGLAKWTEIRAEAGYAFLDSFQERSTYEDNMTYEFIDAACEVLDVEREQLLEDFGEHYMSLCVNSIHGSLLRSLGRNLYDFLSNIDTLHDHLSTAFPGFKMPTLRVKPDSLNHRISVSYFSDRDGFLPMVKGTIRGAAKHLFNLNVTVQSMMELPIGSAATCSTVLVTSDAPDESHLMFPESVERVRELIPDCNKPKVSPLEFMKAFPFHIVFSRGMVMLQIGSTLHRVLKDVNISRGLARITDYFELVRPKLAFDFDAIYSHLNCTFVLTGLQHTVRKNRQVLHAFTDAADTDSSRSELRLKGQMIYLLDPDAMLFLCSPHISNVEDMRKKGLCLSDIPLHDATRDLVLLSDNFNREYEMTKELEIVNDQLSLVCKELDEEKNLCDRLLYSVLPPSIASHLRVSEPVPTESFESVTLLFSGINDFPSLCADLTPLSVVQLLNDLFSRFDALVDFAAPYVYKVETVGDKYMAVSGLPERCTDHARVVSTLALDMLDVSRSLVVQRKPVTVTYGVHSGDVVAGVIGQRMPRYCLFGNNVNLASRTETTGLRGKINITEYTYRLLQEQDNDDAAFVIEKRGEVQMKGRTSPMTTYILSRAPGYRGKIYRAGFFRGSILSNHPGSEPSSPVLTSNPLIGGLTLNRSRCNSSASTWHSRNASNQLSRSVTPLRSRSNSHMRHSLSPFTAPSPVMTVPENGVPTDLSAAGVFVDESDSSCPDQSAD